MYIETICYLHLYLNYSVYSENSYSAFRIKNYNQVRNFND